jgi:group I intron endonuclease
MYKGVIYKISHRESLKVYIGKTRDFKKRIRGHKYAAMNYGTRNERQPIIKAMREHGIDAFDIEVLYTSPEFETRVDYDKHMDAMERHYIHLYDSVRSGYNITKGGAGMLGYSLSEETRKRISDARRGSTISEEHKEAVRQASLRWWDNPNNRKMMSDRFKGEGNPMYGVYLIGEQSHMFGKHHSEETRKKISNACKGKNGTPMSEEHKEKLRNLLTGKPKTEEHRKKISDSLMGRKTPAKWRPILQYSLNGDFIKEWSSITEAQETYKTKHISACANGKRNNAAGYYWQYKTEGQIPQKINLPRSKNESKIAQVDEQGNVIREFNSIKDASKELQLNYSGISNVLQGYQKKTGKNYRFVYLEPIS